MGLIRLHTIGFVFKNAHRSLGSLWCKGWIFCDQFHQADAIQISDYFTITLYNCMLHYCMHDSVVVVGLRSTKR